MKPSLAPAGSAWLPLILMAGAALLLKPIQDRIDALPQKSRAPADVLYFASPEVVKKLSLGYRSLVADVYWMRAIQYYGRRAEAERRPERYKNLAALLEIATTLDPDLMDAYRAGSSFLAEPEPVGAGQPDKAIQLLERGITAHPQDWRLHFDKGFVHYMFLGDYRKAGEVWLAASRIPSTPHWMEGLAASALSRGGAMETAKALWQRQYLESDRADVKQSARDHLESLRAYEDMWTLELLFERYEKRAGRRAGSLDDLLRAGFLRQRPLDPSGIPYEYDPLSATVRLASASRVNLLKVPSSYREEFRRQAAF